MDWKKAGKRILFPPIWLMVLLTIACATLLTLIFVRGSERSVLAYGVYVLSFYTLTVVCIFCALVLPKQCRRIRERIYADPFCSRYLTDRQFRGKISLNLSLSVNLLYVALQGLQWYIFRSWWFVVLAGYYAILSIMRFLLLRYVQRNEIGSSIRSEWKRSRTCACILLLVNLSLSGAVLMILFQNRGYAYNGILIYVIAMYTFYSTIHAAVDIVKYRRLGSPVMSTARIVSLSSALVSMLNLETAMFTQFGADMSEESKRIFIILTGAGVSIIVVTLSVLLIVRATKEMRRDEYGS